MITSRDLQAVEFINEFGAATTEQIRQLFYEMGEDGKPIGQSYTVCKRRLREIIKDTNIKRKKGPVTNQYIYYVGSPTQRWHKALRTELYCRLKKMEGDLKLFEVEYALPGVKADAFFAYSYGGKGYLYFVEVELSNKGLDVAKYERLYLSKDHPFPVFPGILVISDKKIKANTKLKIIRVGTDFSNMEAILK